MSTPSTLTAFDTIYPADSVEFCPHPGYTDYFVCGTYKLDEEKPEETVDPAKEDDSDSAPAPKPQKRIGKCWLMHTDEASGQFKPVQTFELPAVLDLKWSQSRVGSPRVAIADALGRLSFYSLQRESENSEHTEPGLIQDQVLQCTSPNNICLSLDWSDKLLPDSDDGKIITSISDGSLAVVEQVHGEFAVTKTWHAHTFEPWIAAWNYWDENIVYSGGDDSTWKGWDLREDPYSPIFANKRSFEGGVTTIQAHIHRQHYVAVGSYDEHVRIFDTRNPMKPLSTVHVGGGVWRVKWHPSAQRENDLLLACMHDGFKVVRLSSGTIGGNPSSGSDEGEIVTSFKDHDSLAYGVDWSRSDKEGGPHSQTLVASCSFYDHSLRTWFA